MTTAKAARQGRPRAVAGGREDRRPRGGSFRPPAAACFPPAEAGRCGGPDAMTTSGDSKNRLIPSPWPPHPPRPLQCPTSGAMRGGGGGRPVFCFFSSWRAFRASLFFLKSRNKNNHNTPHNAHRRRRVIPTVRKRRAARRVAMPPPILPPERHRKQTFVFPVGPSVVALWRVAVGAFASSGHSGGCRGVEHVLLWRATRALRGVRPT